MAAIAAGLCSSAVTTVQAELIYAVDANNNLLSFDSATPGTVSSIAINNTGGAEIRGLDWRAANGGLYGLGANSVLYQIAPNTGFASPVGGTFSTLLSGQNFGFDVNPVADRIRVVSEADQNMRINPITGAIAAVDSNLSYGAGDPFFGVSPFVTGLAYNNNFAGALSTTLYAIDSLQNTLATIANPNSGVLSTIGLLSFDVSRLNGFDISPSSGTAFVGSPSTSGGIAANLWTVNLATGQGTLVGKIGTVDEDFILRGLTAVPEPGTASLLGLGTLAMMVFKRNRRG